MNLEGLDSEALDRIAVVSRRVFSAYAQDDVEGPPRKVEAPEGLPPGRAF